MSKISDYFHVSVLREEALSYWHGADGGRYVDATLGLGGHSEALLQKDSRAQCCGIDLDKIALQKAKNRLQSFAPRLQLLHGNYSEILSLIPPDWRGNVDGIILDLGVSSMQLEDPSRGFSFLREGPLDMRMNPDSGISALELLQQSNPQQISEIIKIFGEEQQHFYIAKALKKALETYPKMTSLQCAEVIENAMPKKYRYSKSIHPATKTFQALRIAVNGELDSLKKFLADAPAVLKKSGRIVIISFHSLEDRIVKKTFLEWAKSCVCPPSFPICRCEKKASFKILTKKSLRPSEQEMKENPRSRSAKLRAAEKIYESSK